MMDLNVNLEFTCGGCERPVGVSVQCQAENLPRTGDGGFLVNIPCPTCGQINKLVFESTGLVRSVRRSPSIRSFAEPSMN